MHFYSAASLKYHAEHVGAQWLSGRVLDSRPKGHGLEPHRRHCVVSLSKNINPSLVLVQPRKSRPYITERLLMGRKESNQSKKQKHAEHTFTRNCHQPHYTIPGVVSLSNGGHTKLKSMPSSKPYLIKIECKIRELQMGWKLCDVKYP